MTQPGEKDVLMFLAQAADAMPSQSTAGMRVKARALEWISDHLESVDGPDSGAALVDDEDQ